MQVVDQSKQVTTIVYLLFKSLCSAGDLPYHEHSIVRSGQRRACLFKLLVVVVSSRNS